MIIIIFCNFCNGLAVVAWSPLLYILKWNVNLLYYCTHCNWTKQAFLFILFSIFCEYFSKVQSVQSSNHCSHSYKMHERLIYFVCVWGGQDILTAKGDFILFFFRKAAGVTGLLDVTECWWDVAEASEACVYMHWSLLCVSCVCASATGSLRSV